MLADSTFHLPSDQELRERLQQVSSRIHSKAANVSVWSRERESHFSVDDQGQLQPAGPPGNDTKPASCMVKLLATIAVLRICEQCGISLDAFYIDVLKSNCRLDHAANLSGVRVSQLLNHSHGLDGLGLAAYSRGADGRLDLQDLATRLQSVRPLFAPGQLFSYSDAGALLAGALVEHLSGQVFGEYLAAAVLQEMGLRHIVASVTELSAICPTTGGELRLSTTDLMTVGRYLCEESHRRGDASLIGAMSNCRVTFPGWTAMGSFSVAGLNQYEDGWFGYNAATTAEESWALRFNPRSMTAIAVGSCDAKATWLMQEVFRGLLPESAALTPPRPFNDGETTTDPEKMCGTYHTALFSACVTKNGDQLVLTVDNRNDAVRALNTPVRRTLHLAEHNAFYMKPQSTNYFPIGQFLHGPIAQPRYEYLWNGRRLWRRA